MKTTFAAIAALSITCQAQVNVNLGTWLDTPGLYGRQIAVEIDGDSRNVLAGQFLAGQFGAAYCTDIGNTAASGWFTPTAVGLAYNPAHQNPDWVPGGIQKAAGIVRTYGWTVDDAAKAATMQAAVWEALYDATPSASSGRFAFHEPSLVALFATYTSASPVSDGLWLMPTDSLGNYRPAQGMLTDIPEPSTYAAGFVLVAVIFFAVRRK